MTKKKTAFTHLSEIGRVVHQAHTKVGRKSAPVAKSMLAKSRSLYPLMHEGTLTNVSQDWQAQPEILSKSRAQMVEQLRAKQIADETVLAAMLRVPRHVFVDEAFYFRAYDDDALPIGYEQTISHPSTVARMLSLMRESALRLGGVCERVLEIGTGCGYQAAVMACVAREVYSIERVEPLYQLAQHNLSAVHAVLPRQPQIRFGDGMLGWPEVDGFDGIVLAAAGMDVAQTLLDQLRVGAALVAPVVVDKAGMQQLVRITRTGLGHWTREYLDTVHFVPLLAGTRST